MKKRTKITLRTKIYLAIVGLLAVTGILYASNPSIFVMPGHGVFQPVGLAADPNHLFVSQYNDNEIRMVDCNGNGSLFGTLPAPIPPQLTEKYMAIAPAQSAAAGFTPGDLFVTLSEQVFRARPSVSGTFTLFANLSGILGGCPFSDHSAITFDKEGTFFFNMIVTCENGRVWQISNTGIVTHIADTTTLQFPTNIEGPAVLPASFGPLAGQIMVADDINSNLYTIDNLGNVNHNPFGVPPGTFSGAEQVLVIPEAPCAFCGDRSFFTAATGDDIITSYPRSDFDGFGGDVLVTTEGSPPWGTFRVHFDAPSMSYQFSVFDGTAIFKEGSTFVEGMCSPTPTPTATSKPTATFTPTPTATASATFTPTPTATFTPTPTATFTPTPTPTGTVGLPCPAGSFEGGNTGGMAPGDISIAYDQFPAPNDNSYGDNAVGWGSKGHTFGNLTGSDKAGFQIIRPNNTIAVSFNVDYITESNLGSPPSGYKSLGPFGGDGGIVTNSSPPLTSDGTTIQWDTSLARNLNGVQSPFGTYPAPTYFMGGVQTIGLPPGTNTADLQEDSPPVDCSLATDPATCISVFPAPKGIQYPLAVPNPWIKSYDNPEYTNGGGPIPPGAFDAAHVDGWNFHDTFYVTFKQAYLTAIGFDFTNFAIADFDPATNTFTCPRGTWCIAPNPTALHNSPAKPCPSGPCQFSTSIASNFNGTPIAAGNYIWFNSILRPTGLGSNPVTITFTGQTITSANFNLNVPDATVTFDPNVDFATTTFGPGGVSMTTVPSDPPLKGNTFFSGLSFQVPANLPGGINPVTWSGTISVDRPGVLVSWKWAAAVYTNFSTAYNLLGVKPVDEKVQNPYLNSDHAGTPENFKQFVIGGARGGGGSNFTGSYSGSTSVACGQVQRR